MPAITEIREILPYRDQYDLQVEDHDTNDIVKCLKKYHKIHGSDYDKISLPFWKGNAENTGRYLFNFLKKNVRYDTEPEDYQTVKTPSAILHQGHGDCKHYASFITGVVDSLQRKGYPIKGKYRFVSDTPDKDIHHVFAVLEDVGQIGATGRDYWVDPVLNSFDKRPNFYNIKDTDMAKGIGSLYHISGTDNNNLPVIGNIDGLFDTRAKIEHTLRSHNLRPYHFSSPSHLYNFLHHHHSKPGVHNPFLPHQNFVSGYSVGKSNFLKKLAHGMEVNAKNLAHGIKVNAANAKQMALNVGLSPARNAFLGLLDVNGFNMAQKLRTTLLGKDRGALLSKWTSLGGHNQALINAVNNGYRHYKKGHGGYDIKRDHISGVGVVQVAALVALASGIIAELAKFLKHTDQEQSQISEVAKNGIQDITKDVIAAGEGGVVVPGQSDPVQDANFTSRTGKPNMVTNQPAMSVSAGVAPDGTPTVTVHAIEAANVPGPRGPQDGQPGDPDNIPGGGNITNDITAGASNLWHGFTTFIMNNKLVVGLTVAGVVAYKVMNKPGRKKRIFGLKKVFN